MNRKKPEDCQHPRTNRAYETIEIKGHELRAEVCGICGQRTVDPEDTARLLQRKRPGTKGLNAGELALALLGLYPDREVDSKTLLMKEAFLLEKELARKISLDMDNLRFTPHKFGPYSRDFDAALRSLLNNGLITIEGEVKERQAIALTDEGKREAQRVLKDLSPEQVKQLQRKRRGWDQLGHWGILKKVYDEYPAYKTRSEIADDVDPGPRWT